MEGDYEYSTLAENEIRLLEVLPGSEPQVSMRIRNVPLNDHPEYAALSYTWGTEPTDHTVLINQQRLDIKPNLDAALPEFRIRPVWFVPENEPDRYFAAVRSFQALQAQFPPSGSWENLIKITERIKGGSTILTAVNELGVPNDDLQRSQRKELIFSLTPVTRDIETLWGEYAVKEGLPLLYQESHLLWIDAICINQKDSNERSAQVSFMRMIYKEASSLIVWLGPEEDNSSKAVEMLEEFDRQGIRSKLGFDLNKIMWPLDEQEHAWQAMASLFSRPWFDRVWILQEYALGGYRPNGKKDAIVFCCGKDRILDLVELGMCAVFHKYHQAFAAMDPQAEMWRQRRIQIGSIHGILIKYKLRRGESQKHTNGYQLLPLLMRSRLAKSTDPRDRIYSLLGLAEELFGGQPVDLAVDVLIVDYEASVEDVYSSLVKAVVMATKRLDILGACVPARIGYVQRT